MAIIRRRSDAEYVASVRRCDRVRWIWAALAITSGLCLIGAAARTVWLWHATTLIIDSEVSSGYAVGRTIGFTIGRIVTQSFFFGVVAVVVGLVYGFARRKNRLLLRYYDLLVADELESDGG